MSATTGIPRKTLFRVQEVAVIFSVTPRTVYNWIDEGVITSLKVGGARFVTRESLSEVLNRSDSDDIGIGIL